MASCLEEGIRSLFPILLCPSNKEWTGKRQQDQELPAILPETNIASQNRPSQKEISIPTIHFEVLC